MGRAPCCEKVGLKKGKWAKEEDEILANYIKIHGEGSWRSLPKKAGLLRCGKSCRLRWINYLRSDIKRGNFSKEEEELIIKLHLSLGNKWSQIASKLPGRTDNEIKNYWNSHLSRSIQYFHQVNQCKSSETESSESPESSPESSHKSSEKSTNTEEVPRTTETTRKIKNIDKFSHPQNSIKHSDEKAQSEFSNTSDVDGINGSCSPTKFSTTDISSCNADHHEAGTSKELEAINWPSSPDLSAFFKEMDDFLNCETNETNQIENNNSILSDMEDHNLLVQLQAWMEEESQFGEWGCVDSLWDLDLCGLP